MEKLFLDWIEKNRNNIERMGIQIDELVSGTNEYSQASTRADFLSDDKLSRITVFESGRIYIQILNLETSMTEYIFDDIIDSENTFDDFIDQVIAKLI